MPRREAPRHARAGRVGSRAGQSVERALGSLDARRGNHRRDRRQPSADATVRYLRSQGAGYSYDAHDPREAPDSEYDNRPENRW